MKKDQRVRTITNSSAYAHAKEMQRRKNGEHRRSVVSGARSRTSDGKNRLQEDEQEMNTWEVKNKVSDAKLVVRDCSQG